MISARVSRRVRNPASDKLLFLSKKQKHTGEGAASGSINRLLKGIILIRVMIPLLFFAQNARRYYFRGAK